MGVHSECYLSPCGLVHVQWAQGGLGYCSTLRVAWMWLLKEPWVIFIAQWSLPHVRFRIPRGKRPRERRGEGSGPFVGCTLFSCSVMSDSWRRHGLWPPGSSSVHRLNHTFSPLIPYSHPLPLLLCVFLLVYFSLTSLRLSFHICEMGLVGLSPEGNGEETTVPSTQQLVGAQGMSISPYSPFFFSAFSWLLAVPSSFCQQPNGPLRWDGQLWNDFQVSRWCTFCIDICGCCIWFFKIMMSLYWPVSWGCFLGLHRWWGRGIAADRPGGLVCKPAPLSRAIPLPPGQWLTLY